MTEPGGVTNPNLWKVIVGAWKEALSETGAPRVFLVAMLAAMTIPFAPLWMLLWVLERLGMWDTEDGFGAMLATNGGQS